MGTTLRGLFLADFSDFEHAVTSANTRLVEFASGADKVGTRLDAMVDSFSGRKVIQDATLMTEAIERVGGVSMLTEKELARVSKTAAEAATKLTALGLDVPPGLQKIADEAKTVDTAHSTLTGTVKNLALAFAGMFTARAAFNFIKDTIAEASAMSDLSQQTHINVEELQLLAGSMSEFGVDADTLGRGLFKLSRGIAGGDESVAHGLHLMGLSLKDVDGLNGKELFLKIEAGLATLQGGLRDTAAADLFGGKLGAAMAGASEGIQGTLEKWQTLNHVASTESVKAMDEFGESIARAQKNLSGMAANMIGPVAEGFNTLNTAADQGASKWAIAVAMFRDMNDTWAMGSTQTSHLTTLIDDVNKKAEEHAAAILKAKGAHAEATVAVDTRTKAEQFMAALQADAAKALTASQLVDLEHLKEIGALNAKNAEGIGVSAAQYAKYTEAVALAAKADAERATAFKAWLADEMKAQQLEADLEDHMHNVALGHWKEQEAAKKKQLETINRAVVDGNAQIMAVNAELHDAEMKTSMDTATYQIMKIWEVAEADIKAFKGSLEQAAVYGEQRRTLASYAAKAITDVMIAEVDKMFGTATWKFNNFVDTTKQKLDSAMQQYSMVGGRKLTQAELDEYYKTPAGIAEIVRNGGKRYYEGEMTPRAMGGAVSAGQSYMVGERGPELFVPSGSGAILPSGSGGTTIHIYVTQPFGTPDQIARAVGQAHTAAMRGRGERLPVGGL